jgi:hypothetical protein
MCGAFLTIERAPYKNQTFSDACHEAQARYDDLCGDGAFSFVSSPCTDANERAAVLLNEVPDNAFQHYACTPKVPNATVGGTCGDTMSCALSCAAMTGLSNGLPQSCIDSCKTKLATSPKGSFDLGLLMACSQKTCAAAATWQDYLSCAEADCTDEIQWCYGTKG